MYFMHQFTYLGIILDNQGGTDADVRTRIGKARVVFHQLKNILGYSSAPIHQQDKVLQYHREAYTPPWSKDLWNHCHYHKENPCLHQHLPQEDPQDPLARQDLQRRFIEKKKSSDQLKKMSFRDVGGGYATPYANLHLIRQGNL
ncbi:hypothetical protein DPMN_045122 [Dreissena polymorpha]|uniref:Uncharacterized protein n=1 Tax=Dreissena polymorpha TaxID=45954 RepID=A0A9D4HZF6_DREPO|nr:hypothetical protein DPMN_045122 [Dreissena polymorpha]